MYTRHGCISVIVIGIFLILSTVVLFAHDHRYAVTPQQDTWFRSLNSGKGPCCGGPDIDGKVLTDNDWETRDGKYRVKINDQWVDVPDEAVLKQPNLFGPTMIWIFHFNGEVAVRCFIPGMMT